MAQEAQLYIDGQRIDLFSDESIQITSSIQNIRDISKIFSDYTLPFSVKASRNNNVVFKHYHDGDIINGYDARFRSDAVLELNYTPFRTGTVRLNKVLMRNDKAYAYDITFFGSTVTLPNLLGEDKLDSLTYLDNYNHAWNDSNILNGFVSGLTLNSQSLAIIYPFISPVYRMVYDSTDGVVPAKTRNVAVNTTSDETAGIHAVDLKPAIKLIHIIEAIEDKYPEITFSRDFFGTSTFTELYMWLHREAGDILKDSEETEVVAGDFQVDGSPVINCSQDYITVNATSFSFAATALSYNTTSCSAVLTVTPATNGEAYGVTVVDTNTSEVLYQANNLTATETETIVLDGGGLSYRPYNVQVIISKPSSSSLTSVDVAWATTTTNTTTFTSCTNTKNFSITSALSLLDEIIITNHVPDLKVIDFLTGIFKMFNLTAYSENGVIVVKKLDAFYAAGGRHDITNYVDITETEIERPSIYSEIEFKYRQPTTFLSSQYNEQNNEEFGSEKYKVIVNGKYMDGPKYSIELPFEKVLYERLTDDDAASTETSSGYGYFVDKDQNPVKGNPLIFYRVQTTTLNLKYMYLKNIADTSYSQISQYNRPSNVKADGTQTLNFGQENDEFSLSYNNESLFANYYDSYVSSVFNEQSRILKIDGYLPLKILTKYKLNDLFTINGVDYKINTITTNLNTYKSNLELIRAV